MIDHKNRPCSCMCVYYEVAGWDPDLEMVLPVRTDTYQLRIRCANRLLPKKTEIPGRVKFIIPGVTHCFVEEIDGRPDASEIRIEVPNNRKYTDYVLALRAELLQEPTEQVIFKPFHLKGREVERIPEGEWSKEEAVVLH